MGVFGGVSAKDAPSWTEKMRLGILYNLCAKSGAKLFFRRSYGDLGGGGVDFAAHPH